MQLAYQAKTRVDDATITLFICTSILRVKKTHAKLLFVDFSSTCNTIQPHISTNTLNLDTGRGKWVLDFFNFTETKVL